jgi:1-acyl-sn-glycerol-3-phosphate acyltransferase
MLRTLWALAISILATLLCAPLVTVVGIFRSHSPLVDRMVRRWAATIVRSGGIELRMEGLENLDPEKRYIIVANHHSYFDIPCLLAAIPQPLRFMAKVSLFKIPVFGWGLQAAGFIPIDRKNRSSAVKSFEMAAKRIRKGNSIVIFPEEGRSSQREMKQFQRGAFLLAIRSGLPVVPVAIDGTFDIFPVGARIVRPGPVTVRVAPPLETAGTTVRGKVDLADRSRQAIEAMLAGAPPPVNSPLNTA